MCAPGAAGGPRLPRPLQGRAGVGHAPAQQSFGKRQHLDHAGLHRGGEAARPAAGGALRTREGGGRLRGHFEQQAQSPRIGISREQGHDKGLISMDTVIRAGNSMARTKEGAPNLHRPFVRQNVHRMLNRTRCGLPPAVYCISTLVVCTLVPRGWRTLINGAGAFGELTNIPERFFRSASIRDAAAWRFPHLGPWGPRVRTPEVGTVDVFPNAVLTLSPEAAAKSSRARSRRPYSATTPTERSVTSPVAATRGEGERPDAGEQRDAGGGVTCLKGEKDAGAAGKRPKALIPLPLGGRAGGGQAAPRLAR